MPANPAKRSAAQRTCQVGAEAERSAARRTCLWWRGRRGEEHGSQEHELALPTLPPVTPHGCAPRAGSDAEDPLRAAALGEDTATSLYVSAAMSVVAGSHGPEVRAAACVHACRVLGVRTHLRSRECEHACRVSGVRACMQGLGSACAWEMHVCKQRFSYSACVPFA